MASKQRRTTGAWLEGDPVGNRQFFHHRRPFALTFRQGQSLVPFRPAAGPSQILPEITIACETWGTLNADKSNAILVCHAFSGDSHIAGPAGDGHPTAGWWDKLVGPGRALDTDKYFIVASNVLGGCQGSTGPSSINPLTGTPYGSAFPSIAIRDMVNAQALLQGHLGIPTWMSIVGGSMGGYQALEWAIMYPDRVRSIVPIATTDRPTGDQLRPQNAEVRSIIKDPNWRGGDFYDRRSGPIHGLKAARSLAMPNYRGKEEQAARISTQDEWLDEQAEKLVRRFDAGTYVALTRAMDNHDLYWNRGFHPPYVVGTGDKFGAPKLHEDRLAAAKEWAFSRITADALFVGIDTDHYYPREIQRGLNTQLQVLGSCRSNEYQEISSPKGHDAFLVETGQMADVLGPFLARRLDLALNGSDPLLPSRAVQGAGVGLGR